MGRAITRAVVSCLRCSEVNLVGGLPRCGCFVHTLLVSPTASAVAILDGAPRRARRVRVSAAARSRRRGVLARDAVTRYNRPPRWFEPAEAAPTSGPAGGPLAVPVYADAKVRTRADRTGADDAAADEIIRGGRSFVRACTLVLEPDATLEELHAQLQAAHGIRCTAVGRARAWAAGAPPAGGEAALAERPPDAELGGLDGLLVEILRAQLGCRAQPFFAQPGDVLCAW